MQRVVKVDGKVRTDVIYLAGFIDVVSSKISSENFRLVYFPKSKG